MRNNYVFRHQFIKIKLSAQSLWMDFGRGEGELEIVNQGRFGKRSRFTQETEAIGQQPPRIGGHRLKLRFTQRVSSAGCTWTSDSTPLFLSQAASVQNTLADIIKASRFESTTELTTEKLTAKFELTSTELVTASKVGNEDSEL